MSLLSALGVVVLLAGVAVVGLLALVGFVVLVPIATATAQRMKIEREAGDAAWAIHHQATEAISRMLSEAAGGESDEG